PSRSAPFSSAPRHSCAVRPLPVGPRTIRASSPGLLRSDFFDADHEHALEVLEAVAGVAGTDIARTLHDLVHSDPLHARLGAGDALAVVAAAVHAAADHPDGVEPVGALLEADEGLGVVVDGAGRAPRAVG